MHESVSFNGTLVSPESTFLGAISCAALYGKGVFTTMRVVNGEPFLWDKHWKRLSNDARKLGIETAQILESGALSALQDIISGNEVIQGKARLTVFDGSASPLWPSKVSGGSSILIQTGDLPSLAGALRVGVSPYRINPDSPLSGVKSCNYLEPVLALESARANGFGEAIRLNNDGAVTSGCVSNVFWRSRESGQLRTPSESTGCLPGTTREFILENLRAAEVVCDYPEFLADADRVFLTSSVKGVQSVHFLEGIGELGFDDDEMIQLISGAFGD